MGSVFFWYKKSKYSDSQPFLARIRIFAFSEKNKNNGNYICCTNCLGGIPILDLNEALKE